MRYYDNLRNLNEISMDDMKSLIDDEANKQKISEYLYHRIFDRFLKPFFYHNPKEKRYNIKSSTSELKNEFGTEYKSGFLMMASSCLCIDTISSFIEGSERSITPGKQGFEIFFNKCLEYGNPLSEFKDKEIYKNVRNGILHQGETYDSFKISRTGELFNPAESKINATKFVHHLNLCLESYKTELSKVKWDGKLWDNCRQKIRFILLNA
jgi:predicted DNA binding CopG/RHH family protein